MPSHFSTIGFAIESQEELVALAEKALAVVEPVQTTAGRYLRYRCGGGEELWIQEDEEGGLIGINPHFSGRSALRLGLASAVRRDTDTALDGAFYCHVDPDVSDPVSGVCPLVFDCPDFGASSRLALPAIVTAQVAAFAHDITVHASVEEYEAAQATEKVRLASRSFLPTGLFAPDMTKREPPDAFAILTGHVVEAAEKRNPMTEHRYYWALVESLGGSFDVVMDPRLITEPPRRGGVVSGTVWLSGRIIDRPN
ncbi:MAG: hypothetical protein U0441_37580 [Polyangiaceae bacterium]